MIIYVSQKRYQESREQEQQLPSNEHEHHLPSREGKKNLRSRLREATATVYGTLRVSCDTEDIIAYFLLIVNTNWKI